MRFTASGIGTSTAVGPGVWDRLWRNVPDESKDAARLAKEHRGPRWRLTHAYLMRSFGRIEGLRIVELGSGLGDVSVLLAQCGAEVTMLDYCGRALDEARKRFARLGLAATFVQADLLADPLPLACDFDAALSVGVIEHFRGDARTSALRAHAAVLRCGGAVLLTVPHAWCPSYRLWKAYLELREWWPYGMEIPYTRGELRRRAHEAGLIDTRFESFGLRESLTDHLCRQVLGLKTRTDERSSRWDRWLGLVLMMTARKA